MIRPVDLCYWACIACYAPITPGIFDHVLTVEDITVCVRYDGSDTAIIFPGSETDDDWRDDFEVIPYVHPVLGTLHWGFWKYLPAVWLAVKPLIKGRLYVGGHSLGGAHAAGLAAIAGLDDIHTTYMALFEAPRVGCEAFIVHLDTYVDEGVLTWNGLDPVPAVPFAPWRDSWKITRLDGKPGGLSDANPFAYHMGALVYKTYMNAGLGQETQIMPSPPVLKA